MNINDEKNLSEISHDEKKPDSVEAEKDFQETNSGIVSVNERGDQEDGMGKKIAFVVGILILFVVGGLFAYNKIKGSREDAAEAEAEKNAPNPELNSSNKRRDFTNTDPAVPSTTDANANANGELKSLSACNDQSVPKQAVDPSGNPILRNGMHVFVCNDGQQILKQPENTATTQPQQASVTVQPQVQPQVQVQPQAQQSSRYGGAIFVNESNRSLGGFGSSAGNRGSNLDARTQQAYNQVAGIMRHAEAQNAAQNGSNNGGGFGSLASGFRGGNTTVQDDDEEDTVKPVQATRATSNMGQATSSFAQARFLGNRNFLLAKGRVIKCNLSTKVVSEIGGMASCVIPQPVYSDNGKVVLAEAGSEVLGEYKSISTQGQRRLHILWTRLKTPHGVVVDLDSPASDALGTAGVSGKVDNRWGSRIGAAFMLSLVQDGIAYGIAKETEGSNQQYVLQNTSEAGKTMAEKVLDSTINIKPTIFTKQGDIASIYVAKDIDFRGVYELKAK